IAESAPLERVQELVRYAAGLGVEPGDEPEKWYPVRIVTPSGEVVFDEPVPEHRTVRSVLQTLRAGATGRLSLLRGTEVVPPDTKFAHLGLTDEDCLSLVRRAFGSYTPWTDDVQADHLIKCLIMGPAEVGKTAWIHAFSREGFIESYKATIGVDFKMWGLKTGFRLQAEDGTKLKIQLWDTAGQPRFRPITNAYFKNAAGILAFFSLKSRATFDEVVQMLDKALTDHPSTRCFCLVGTHADVLDPEVTEGEAEQFAKERRWPFFAISNKTAEGIDDPFYSLLDSYMDDFARR
ncbi:YPTM2, partial [Symbiodinium pilosum]